MRKFKMAPKAPSGRPDWREYQNSLKKPKMDPNGRRRIMTVFAASLLLCAIAIAVRSFSSSAIIPKTSEIPKKPGSELYITKKDARILLQDMRVENLSAEQISLPLKNQKILVRTSLDPGLQNYLLQSMDRKNSRYIGIVVMQAASGRIVAMAGFNKIDPTQNPCTERTFPAASIFKIVTAAAAVDHCGYNANTTMRFNGYKHTLYKNQLKERNNRHTNRLSFKDAFAQSVNPVFGKLGTAKLGKNVLEEYAIAFGFNQPIHFELAVTPSRIQIKDTPYHWAEIASGFNNDTVISPVHGAMIASAVLNDGRMVAPTIVDRMEDQNGKLLYRSQPEWRGRAMTSRASEELAKFMETTVRSGTGRKTFRNQKRHKILSKLRIGGKTGNIFNRSHDARFDWFVGFAKEKKGDTQLVFAALVAHEKYIGIRAAQYARMAVTHYFKNQIARHEDKRQDTGS